MNDCVGSTDLLLLPGMMCDERLWQHQVDALGDQCRVQVGSLTGAASIRQLAASVLAMAPQRFALAGLSMGGIVAFEMWRQSPQRIERLALLDTNFRADPPVRQRMRDTQIQSVRSGHLQQVLRDELKPNYLAHCHKQNTALLDKVMDMGVQLGEAVFVEQSEALRDRPDSTATLETIDCPTLVLCGEEDELCPISLHETMVCSIKTAALEVVERCGHLSPLEQPDQVTRAMQQWLRAG